MSLYFWNLLQLWNHSFQSHQIQRLYRIQGIHECSLHKRILLRSYWLCLHQALVSKQTHKISLVIKIAEMQLKFNLSLLCILHLFYVTLNFFQYELVPLVAHYSTWDNNKLKHQARRSCFFTQFPTCISKYLRYNNLTDNWDEKLHFESMNYNHDTKYKFYIKLYTYVCAYCLELI